MTRKHTSTVWRWALLLALAIAVAMNFFSYWFSHKIVLAMYRAQPITEAQAPGSRSTCFAMMLSCNRVTSTPMEMKTP